MNRRENRTLWILLPILSLALVLVVGGCGGQKGGTEGDSLQISEAPPAETPGAGADAPSRPAPPRTQTLAASTVFVGSLEQTIDTGKNKVGDKITLRTVEPVKAGAAIVVPQGATIRGEVTHIDPAGRIAGGAELTLRFNELVMADGTSYPIDCEPFRLQGKGQAKESALEIGGGAVAGGVLGGVLGGKDDIAKGAAAGAVIGTGVAIATKGKQIVLPVGQKLEVKTTEPVTITLKKTTS